jgi:hypothetical protein
MLLAGDGLRARQPVLLPYLSQPWQVRSMITKTFPLISWFIYMKGKCFVITAPSSRYAAAAGRRMATADTASPLSKRDWCLRRDRAGHAGFPSRKVSAGCPAVPQAAGQLAAAVLVR